MWVKICSKIILKNEFVPILFHFHWQFIIQISISYSSNTNVHLIFRIVAIIQLFVLHCSCNMIIISLHLLRWRFVQFILKLRCSVRRLVFYCIRCVYMLASVSIERGPVWWRNAAVKRLFALAPCCPRGRPSARRRQRYLHSVPDKGHVANIWCNYIFLSRFLSLFRTSLRSRRNCKVFLV